MKSKRMWAIIALIIMFGTQTAIGTEVEKSITDLEKEVQELREEIEDINNKREDKREQKRLERVELENMKQKAIMEINRVDSQRRGSGSNNVEKYFLIAVLISMMVGGNFRRR